MTSLRNWDVENLHPQKVKRNLNVPIFVAQLLDGCEACDKPSKPILIQWQTRPQRSKMLLLAHLSSWQKWKADWVKDYFEITLRYFGLDYDDKCSCRNLKINCIQIQINFHAKKSLHFDFISEKIGIFTWRQKALKSQVWKLMTW